METLLRDYKEWKLYCQLQKYNVNWNLNWTADRSVSSQGWFTQAALDSLEATHETGRAHALAYRTLLSKISDQRRSNADTPTVEHMGHYSKKDMRLSFIVQSLGFSLCCILDWTLIMRHPGCWIVIWQLCSLQSWIYVIKVKPAFLVLRSR